MILKKFLFTIAITALAAAQCGSAKAQFLPGNSPGGTLVGGGPTLYDWEHCFFREYGPAGYNWYTIICEYDSCEEIEACTRQPCSYWWKAYAPGLGSPDGEKDWQYMTGRCRTSVMGYCYCDISIEGINAEITGAGGILDIRK